MAASEAPPTPDDSTDEVETNGDIDPELVEALDIKTSYFGWLQEWRTHKAKRRKARKGYIQWYLIDGAWPEPRFVKPKQHAHGMPEYEHKGKTYFFPPGAAVPSAKEGMRTVIHHVDDAKPVNVTEPGKPAIDPASVKKYISMGAVTGPPGWLANLNWDTQTMMRVMLMVIIGGTLIWGVLNGGIA